MTPIPSQMAAVTVIVTVEDGTVCRAFGTLTFTPVVETQGWVKSVDAVRRFARSIERRRRAVQRVQEDISVLVDPIWGLLRAVVRRTVPRQVRVPVKREVGRLAIVARRLAKPVSWWAKWFHWNQWAVIEGF